MVFLSDYFQFWKRIRKTFLWYLYFLFSFSWKCIDCYVFHIIICHLNFKFTFVYIGVHNLLSKNKSKLDIVQKKNVVSLPKWIQSFQYFCVIQCLSLKLHVHFTLYSITCRKRWKQQWYTWFCSGSLTAMSANHLAGSKSEQFVT